MKTLLAVVCIAASVGITVAGQSLSADHAKIQGVWRLVEETTPPGDVLSLVEEPDGLFAVFGTGDEVALEFDSSALAPPAPGLERTWFLVSTGYARDGDPNTEPLPWGR